MKTEIQKSAPHAVEQIWKHFHDKLRNFILAKVKDEALADDLLQEVFIKIHRQLGQLRDETSLQSWIYQIAKNTVYDHFRKPGIRGDEKIENAEDIMDESDHEAMIESVEDMIKMMDSMPPDYCEILCETELRGLSHKEYADKHHLSVNAVKTRAYRARNLLKEMLMNCCHYQFDAYGTVFDILPKDCCCCCVPGAAGATQQNC